MVHAIINSAGKKRGASASPVPQYWAEEVSLPQIFLNLHHEVGVVLEQELFLAHLTLNINVHASVRRSSTHPAKIDLNKKWLPMQKTIQNFNIDTQGLKK